jgi:hypothetical protein
MRKIRPIDLPEDVIEQVAEAGKVDTAMAVDMLAWLANIECDAVVDFDFERFLDRTRRDIASGYFNRRGANGNTRTS